MALVAHSDLPAFETMRAEGVPVVSPEVARSSGLPDVKVGLLNLMPDAALRATDRQFMRLVSAAAGEADVWVHPFTVAAEHRGEEARRHVSDHYSGFDDIRRHGVDGLIVTGANPARHLLTEEVFWDGLGEVLDWARESTGSVLCSCLATHAVLERYEGLRRTRLPGKRWGVYQHRILEEHPLLEDVANPVPAPHSHWYDVTRSELEEVGATVLMESEEAGVHMAVSRDDFFVFFQGHPEYDGVSLLKEYRRELGRWYRGEREDYPPVPEHYFDPGGLAAVEAYRPVLERARAAGSPPPGLDEGAVLPCGSPPWTETGRLIYRNWVGRLRR